MEDQSGASEPPESYPAENPATVANPPIEEPLEFKGIPSTIEQFWQHVDDIHHDDDGCVEGCVRYAFNVPHNFALRRVRDFGMPGLRRPDPCLVAILLVIKTRHGPKFIFNYPDVPSEGRTEYGRSGRSLADEDASSEDEWSSEDEFEALYGQPVPQPIGLQAGTVGKVEGEHSEEEAAQKNMPWDTVFGYTTTGLEGMLTPGRAFNKKKFELGLKNLLFLSYPVHIREDGNWMKRKDKRKKSTGTGPSDEAKSTVEEKDIEIDDVERELKEIKMAGATVEDEDNRSESTSDVNAMTSFNVVFVLDPPVLEAQARAKDMYEHVVKKFSKALKFEQAKSNYVWKECEMITQCRDKARKDRSSMSSLWHTILSRSTLAKAISEVYHSISTSRIAHVFLNNSFDVSLQIPQLGATSILPGLIDPQMPGIWLTTANSYDQDESNSDNLLAKHFALLLLAPPEQIIKEVEEGESKQFAAPLINYIRCSSPTQSFLQVSLEHKIPLGDINVLARHLIYWRRARAIPPLHQRDIYIVSPNCDLQALPAATSAYLRAFPTMPSLGKLLAMLSGPPRPYKTLIPSKDHRAAYLDILAWLMRGGWVTQLRTFAWVQVLPQIKAVVQATVVKEQRSTSGSAAQEKTNSNGSNTTTDNEDKSKEKPKEKRKSDFLTAGPEDIAPGYLSPPANLHTPVGSHSSAASTLRSSLMTRRDILSTPLFPPTNKTSAGNPQNEVSLILDPHKASALESQWITAIGESFQDEMVRECWERVVRYFNGRHALEKIAVREGLKRKDVWKCLIEMEESGAIVVARHW